MIIKYKIAVMSGFPQTEELRKIQLTGGSTYIISLPKKWVEGWGLKKGSLMRITRQDDLSFRVQSTELSMEEKTRKAIIKTSEEESSEALIQRFISTYLLGANIISIQKKSRIDSLKKMEIKRFTRKKLVGTEIITDYPEELTLQVLLNYSDLTINDALRRMGIIATSMHRDALIALENDDSLLLKEIIETDDEVDRFGLYSIRLLNVAVANNSVLQSSKLMSPRECLEYRLIIKSIERMADHAVNIAQNCLSLTMKELDENVVKALKDLVEKALIIFENSLDALFSQSYQGASDVIMAAKEIRDMEAEKTQTIMKHEAPDTVPLLRLILESIIRSAEYGADIAEAVLNMTVLKEISVN